MRLIVKRAIDIVGAAIGLIVLSPLIIGTAVAVRVVDGGPVLFRQRRPGIRGEPFEMVKFRTMRPPRPDEVWYLTDDERVTRLGRSLRASSLDELPELWAVLRGRMSIVGPRPLLVEYLASYSDDQRRRHDMRPGLTSLAVVEGRHVLDFERRLALDTWYVDNWSLHLDARIVGRTIVQIVRRRGASATQSVAAVGFPLPLQPPRDRAGVIPSGDGAAPRSDPPRPAEKRSGDQQLP